MGLKSDLSDKRIGYLCTAYGWHWSCGQFFVKKEEANILFQPSCWICCEDFKHFYHQAYTEPSPWFHFYCIKPFMKTIANSSSSPSSSSLSSQLSSGKSVVMWSVLCARAPPPLAPWAPARSPALPRFQPSFVPFLSLLYLFVLL